MKLFSLRTTFGSIAARIFGMVFKLFDKHIIITPVLKTTKFENVIQNKKSA